MAMRGTTKKAGAAFVHQLLGLWGGLFLGGLFGCFVVNLSLAFEMFGLVDSLLARLHHRPVETLVLLLDHHLAQPILLRVHQLLLLLLAQLLLRFANFHLHLSLFRLLISRSRYCSAFINFSCSSLLNFCSGLPTSTFILVSSDSSSSSSSSPSSSSSSSPDSSSSSASSPSSSPEASSSSSCASSSSSCMSPLSFFSSGGM